jgi:replicative DNA helicase
VTIDHHAAELALVGATLLDPGTLRETSAVVSPASFDEPRLGAVYGIAHTLWTNGQAVDAVTVDAAAREARVRGVDAVWLHDVIERTPTAANAGFYARLVSEAYTRRLLHTFGLRAQQLSEADHPLAEVMTAARGEWERLASAGYRSLEAQTLGEVLAGDDRYDWLIPDLLERGDRVVITGGEGGGKTTWVRQLGILSAAGLHPTLFRPMAPLRVLVVDSENTERQWRRQARRIVGAATHYGTTPPEDRMHLVTVDRMPKGRLNLTDDRDLGAVHRLIDLHRPDLLLIGPLYKLTNGAITNDDHAAPLVSALDSLRGRGVALVMEAHAGKGLNGAGERDLAPRGSAALLGWPEFGFGLRRILETEQDEHDEYRRVKVVRWRGDRDTGRAWPDHMYADPRNPFPWTPENIGPATIAHNAGAAA